jgi:hypothetical protein
MIDSYIGLIYVRLGHLTCGPHWQTPRRRHQNNDTRPQGSLLYRRLLSGGACIHDPSPFFHIVEKISRLRNRLALVKRGARPSALIRSGDCSRSKK